MSGTYYDTPPGLAKDAGTFGTLIVDLEKLEYKYRSTYGSAFQIRRKFDVVLKREGTGKIKKVSDNTFTLLKTSITVENGTMNTNNTTTVKQVTQEDYGPITYRYIPQCLELLDPKDALRNTANNRYEWYK